MSYFDAHNHLQDARFGGCTDNLISRCGEVGVERMVVNGSCVADWSAVEALACTYPRMVLPSFGIHPWEAPGVSRNYLEWLTDLLDRWPHAGVGEIGIDRWKPDLPYEGQEAVFIAQLRLAAERNRPASIHGLRAWGRLLELLRAHPRPARGFLLHSYGGPAEMVGDFTELGAYFSFPGSFLQPGATRKHAAFLRVPLDRLLMETDAPDQLPPEAARTFACEDEEGRSLNHPANLPAIYAGAAGLLGLELKALVHHCRDNFARLFGAVQAA